MGSIFSTNRILLAALALVAVVTTIAVRNDTAVSPLHTANRLLGFIGIQIGQESANQSEGDPQPSGSSELPAKSGKVTTRNEMTVTNSAGDIKVTPPKTPNVTLSPTVSPLSPSVSPKTPTPSPTPKIYAWLTPTPAPTQTPVPTTVLSPSPTASPTPPPTDTPSPTPAQSVTPLHPVVINEIAWMGTATSSNDEWMELYNPNPVAIDLTGWTLKSLTGPSFDPKITLLPGKIIQQYGYFLLERSDDNTISDIPADQTYTGALNNDPTSEILELRDYNGNLVDSVGGSGAWFAGNNTDKSSMERKDPLAIGTDPANWATNNGTIINGHDAANQPILGTPRAKNSVTP